MLLCCSEETTTIFTSWRRVANLEFFWRALLVRGELVLLKSFTGERRAWTLKIYLVVSQGLNKIMEDLAASCPEYGGGFTVEGRGEGFMCQLFLSGQKPFRGVCRHWVAFRLLVIVYWGWCCAGAGFKATNGTICAVAAKRWWQRLKALASWAVWGERKNAWTLCLYCFKFLLVYWWEWGRVFYWWEWGILFIQLFIC